MTITENIEVSDKILANGGFADVRTGTHMGHLVAVKTMRVSEQDDFQKLRKVSVDDVSPSAWCVFLTTSSSNFAKKLSSGTRCPIRTS